jgi:hypothetical protein
VSAVELDVLVAGSVMLGSSTTKCWIMRGQLPAMMPT